MNALVTQNLGKKYEIYGRPLDRLLEWATLGRKQLHEDFWALRGVNLEVKKGQTLGIVGSNGAGKSTLLKLLSGICSPSEGAFQASGLVTGLLELGAGFHPEFTGRDNAIMSCSLMGMTRGEINRRVDEIREFAEIGDFFDQPVKTYSSGMYMRLGFSVAACLDPDILVVDEALAVGDEYFLGKSTRKFEELRQRGKTMLIVSHMIRNIRILCDEAVLLEHGRLIDRGGTDEVCDRYLVRVAEQSQQMAQAKAGGAGDRPPAEACAVEFEKQEILNGKGEVAGVVRTGESFTVRARYRINRDVNMLAFTVNIYHTSGTRVISHSPLVERIYARDWAKQFDDLWPEMPKKLKGQTGVASCIFETMPLQGGTYYADFEAYELELGQLPRTVHAAHEHAYFTIVPPPAEAKSQLYVKARWEDKPDN